MGKRGYPCHLIKHNWDIRSDKNFFLSDNDCVMHDIPKYFGGFNERCYNFSKGMRILIYVRKNEFGTSSSKEMDISKYQNLLIQRKAFEKKREEEEYAARLAFEIDSALKQAEARRLSAERKEVARRMSAERKKDYQKRKSINYEIDDLANIIQRLKLRSPQKKQEKGNVEIIQKPKAKKTKALANPKAKVRTKVNPKAKANLKNKIERIIKKQLKSSSL